MIGSPSEPPATSLAAVDEAFRRNLIVLPPPPTRFYLNLTERCQLRCRHCITRAPELTALGTARSLGETVLDRLRPHLRHAAYVGLTHAGEPLLAPTFTPLLEALAEARAGAPTVVHLLSNGLALTPERFREITRLGVSSISISVDGMSPATHDDLRVGSRIELLLERIGELAELRRRERPGVRLGIAWTITRSNLPELDALVRYAAAAGLDWVKLEETYPINAVAAREAAIEPHALAGALLRAAQLASGLGLPLLDHTRPQPVWKCQLHLDPTMAHFSRLDDLVNRMEINPCRLGHELVCVEPDGAVKPLSFHHPSAGNLLSEDLAAIWASAAFVAVRAEQIKRRLCHEGPPTCAADPGPTAW